MLADRALASVADVEESKPGVAEIKVAETTKLVGLLEDLSKRLKNLETATAAEKKRNQGRGRVNNHYAPRPTFIPNAQRFGIIRNRIGRTFTPPIESRHYGARITKPVDYYSTRCTYRSSFRS